MTTAKPTGDNLYDERGLPVLSLMERIDALRYCAKGGADEDSLGHVIDLLLYFLPEDEGVLDVIERYTGKRPVS